MCKEKDNVITSELEFYHAARATCARYNAELLRRVARSLKAWFVAHLVTPIRQRQAEASQLRELMAMDDRMLHDLGITRSGIRYAFDHGRETPAPANSNTPLGKAPHAA